jgi:tRNA(Ile)-lysidine synthase
MIQQSNPFNAERLSARLAHFTPAKTYWVGFSGGADSTALIYAFNELKTFLKAKIKAIHFNHGLHQDADQWQQECQEVCDSLGIDLRIKRLSIDGSSGKGIEAEARHLRYSYLETSLIQGDCFVTGHHQEDQAETLLLNLARGSGVDGLAGMPESRSLGQARLIRPLLTFSMSSFRSYLENQNISWIEDSSNQDQTYDRNFLRQTIIPLLSDRWNGISEKMALSAGHCRQASAVISTFCSEKLADHLVHDQVFKLNGLNPEDPVFAMLLRQWFRFNRAPSMPLRQIEQLSTQITHASDQSNISICWQGWTVHYYRGAMWLQLEDSIVHSLSLTWSSCEAIDLGEVLGNFGFDPEPVKSLPDLELKSRQGGEKILESNSEHRRELKDLFQKAGVPPWLRESVPLLFSSGELVAVGDMFVSKTLADWMQEENSKLYWQPSDPVLKYIHAQFHSQTVDHSVSVG